MQNRNQKLVGGGVGTVLTGIGLWDVGIFSTLRKIIDAVGNVQTLVSIGDTLLPIALILGGCISFAWGFGIFERLKEWRRIGPQQMPLLELRDMAAQQGWDFSSPSSLHICEFAKALRQAGRLNYFHLWGRKNRNDFESLNRDEPLEKIKSIHWSDYQINFGSLASVCDNYYAESYSMYPKDGLKGYRDLHVERRSAIRWLAQDATDFRGRSKPL